MSRKRWIKEQLEEFLYQSGDSEADNYIEIKDVSNSDSDDSVADLDFTSDESKVGEVFENELVNIWTEPRIPRILKNHQRLTHDLAQARLSAPCTSVFCSGFQYICYTSNTYLRIFW